MARISRGSLGPCGTVWPPTNFRVMWFWLTSWIFWTCRYFRPNGTLGTGGPGGSLGALSWYWARSPSGKASFLLAALLFRRLKGCRNLPPPSSAGSPGPAGFMSRDFWALIVVGDIYPRTSWCRIDTSIIELSTSTFPTSPSVMDEPKVRAVAHSARPQSIVPVIARWHQRGHVIILAIFIGIIQSKAMWAAPMSNGRLGASSPPAPSSSGSCISMGCCLSGQLRYQHSVLFCNLQSLKLKIVRSICCKSFKASGSVGTIFLQWLHQRFGSAADLASDLYHKRRFAASGFLCWKCHASNDTRKVHLPKTCMWDVMDRMKLTFHIPSDFRLKTRLVFASWIAWISDGFWMCFSCGTDGRWKMQFEMSWSAKMGN